MDSISEKRKKVMDIILTTMKLLDPSGKNVELYKNKFSKMSKFTNQIY